MVPAFPEDRLFRLKELADFCVNYIRWIRLPPITLIVIYRAANQPAPRGFLMYQSIGLERRWVPRFLTVGTVSVPYVTRDKAIATICRSIVDKTQICVAFCNSNTMLHAFRSAAYARTLTRFLVLNDGLGLDLCSTLFEGVPFPENLNGTDFVPELLASSGEGCSVYLLGTTRELVEAASTRLARQFPNCRIVGVRDGYFPPAEIDQVIADINATSPDILLVGLGNPLQEEFIAKHSERINARALIGVGALLDFVAGKVPRAPKLLRKLRLEWLVRLAHEPSRLGRRYTVDAVIFLGLILRFRLVSLLRGTASTPIRMRLRPDT
jgi:beta-1,4-glucosyltransferase